MAKEHAPTNTNNLKTQKQSMTDGLTAQVDRSMYRTNDSALKAIISTIVYLLTD